MRIKNPQTWKFAVGNLLALYLPAVFVMGPPEGAIQAIVYPVFFLAMIAALAAGPLCFLVPIVFWFLVHRITIRWGESDEFGIRAGFPGLLFLYSLFQSACFLGLVENLGHS